MAERFYPPAQTTDVRPALLVPEDLFPESLCLVAERAIDEVNTEFLLSRDTSFQPMQIINGPEGALYIADLHGGGDHGRIYRIIPDRFRQPKPPQLGKATTYELVAALAHTNGWYRDTAARLLFERRDPA